MEREARRNVRAWASIGHVAFRVQWPGVVVSVAAGGEDRDGRGWIDIVTGVSSGFLGGATERVSRKTVRPMYQLTRPGTRTPAA